MTIDIEDFEYAVAERFGPIPKHRRDKTMASTPRSLAQFLAGDIPATATGPSLTVRAFYRIRDLLAHCAASDPVLIRPSTRCADLFPNLAARPAAWRKVRVALEIPQAPRLDRPAGLEWFIALAAAGVTLGVVVSATMVLPTAFIFPAMLLAGGHSVHIGLRLTRRWAWLFTPPDLSVGTLAYYVVAYGSPILGDLQRPVHRSQMLEVIQALARLEIGASHVHPDATWQQLYFESRAS